MTRIYLLLLMAIASTAVFSQQLPSQVQAKRGVFTERLFLKDKWIDGISTDLNTSDSASNNMLATGKAIAEFIKMHSGKNLATDSLTADSNYTHNWNHKQLFIDSIKALRLFSSENDESVSGTKKSTFTFSTSNNIFGTPLILQTALRNSSNTADSIQHGLRTIFGATQLVASEAMLENPRTSIVGAAAVGGSTRASMYSEQGTMVSTVVVTPNEVFISGNDSIGFGNVATTTTADSVYVPGPFNDVTTSNRLYKASVSDLLSSNLSATNGLTKTDNAISLGGTITQPITLSGDIPQNNITINGFTGLSNTPTLHVKTVGTLGIGVQGEAPYYGVVGKSTNYGVYAEGTTAAGISAQSTSGYGGQFKTISGRAAIYGSVQPAANSYITSALILDRNSLNPGADGIGLSIDLNNKTSTNAMALSNQLFSKWRDATFNTRTSVFGITGTGNAVSDTLFELDGTGKVRLKKYADGGSFTSTDTTSFKPAAFDAAGNLYRMQNWPASARGTASSGQYYAQISIVTVSGNEEKSLTESGYGSLTIPASAWFVGKSFRITIHGKTATQLSDTIDLTLRLKLGNTTIASTENLKFFPGTHQFSATVNFTCNETGSSGRLFTFGTLSTNNNVYNLNNSGFDWSVINTNADQPVDVTMQMADDSFLRTVTAYIINLEEIN